MTNHQKLNWQTGTLVVLRFLMGWHLLYEGVFKWMHPEWSSAGYLSANNWIFSGIADWIISNDSILTVVDQLNIIGLVAIGLGLILGLFTKPAAIAGTILLLLYYLFNPPFIGMNPLVPAEGNYLIVNKTLIEAICLLLIAVSPAAKLYGLDMFFRRK